MAFFSVRMKNVLKTRQLTRKLALSFGTATWMLCWTPFRQLLQFLSHSALDIWIELISWTASCRPADIRSFHFPRIWESICLKNTSPPFLPNSFHTKVAILRCQWLLFRWSFHQASLLWFVFQQLPSAHLWRRSAICKDTVLMHYLVACIIPWIWLFPSKKYQWQWNLRTWGRPPLIGWLGS